MSVVDAYFGIPYGAVWSNLLASLICVGVAWWRLRAKLVRQHVEALTQASRHHKEKLAQAATHHQELKAALALQGADIKDHVSAVAADGPVSGGPGSNPGPEGFPADGPVVPPPAAKKVELVELEPKTLLRRRRGERM